MALVCLNHVKLKAGSHHVYNHSYKVKEEVDCFLKHNMSYSENTIILKSNEILVRHVTGPLAEKYYWEKKEQHYQKRDPWGEASNCLESIRERSNVT